MSAATDERTAIDDVRLSRVAADLAALTPAEIATVLVRYAALVGGESAALRLGGLGLDALSAVGTPHGRAWDGAHWHSVEAARTEGGVLAEFVASTHHETPPGATP